MFLVFCSCSILFLCFPILFPLSGIYHPITTYPCGFHPLLDQPQCTVLSAESNCLHWNLMAFRWWSCSLHYSSLEYEPLTSRDRQWDSWEKSLIYHCLFLTVTHPTGTHVCWMSGWINFIPQQHIFESIALLLYWFYWVFQYKVMGYEVMEIWIKTQNEMNKKCDINLYE